MTEERDSGNGTTTKTKGEAALKTTKILAAAFIGGALVGGALMLLLRSSSPPINISISLRGSPSPPPASADFGGSSPSSPWPTTPPMMESASHTPASANFRDYKTFAGTGMFYHPYEKDDPDFLAEQDAKLRKLIGTDKDFIVRRYCPTCRDSHKDIYYVRKTSLPPELNFYDLLLNNWMDRPLSMIAKYPLQILIEDIPEEERPSSWNTLKQDFDLYSNLDDALARNDARAWAFCNYNDPRVGFPRDCHPEKGVSCQWNAYTRGLCHYGGSASSHEWSIYTGAK